jgi:Lar family restriction alleviation protein
MKKKETALKPCPFCGETALFLVPPYKSKTYLVYCDNCTARGAWALSRNGAIAAWNRRVM